MSTWLKRKYRRCKHQSVRIMMDGSNIGTVWQACNECQGCWERPDGWDHEWRSIKPRYCASPLRRRITTQKYCAVCKHCGLLAGSSFTIAGARKEFKKMTARIS